MGNSLGYYQPYFYANEALIQLEKALGMGVRVHRGFDEERRAFNKGEYINIRRPSTFAADDAPSTAQDLKTGSVQIQLAYWREVKFKLTDKELALSEETLIDEHIAPAAYALAYDVDTKLAALYKDIPWYVDLNSTIAIDDITNVYQVMFDNGVPMGNPNNLHYMMGGALQNGFQQLTAFNQYQGAGPTGVNTQLSGSLGVKFGMECFGNQNVQSHTAGTCADATGAINNSPGGYAAGATEIAINGVTDGGTWKAGDTFVIAGNSQRYAVTADVTFTGGAGTVKFTPALVAAAAHGAVVTGRVDTHVANMAFHRNAFALATAPLSTMGNELGAKIATVYNEKNGLSLRSRIYYVGNSSEVHVALDILYGVKTLDPNLACRACG
jgi:hypothetical protein